MKKTTQLVIINIAIQHNVETGIAEFGRHFIGTKREICAFLRDLIEFNPRIISHHLSDLSLNTPVCHAIITSKHARTKESREELEAFISMGSESFEKVEQIFFN